MKLLTLNTHSLVDENFSAGISELVDLLIKESVDVIALQEVNQRVSSPEVKPEDLKGFIPCGGEKKIRADNYAYTVAKELEKRGVCYSWTWLSVKLGYGKYDEGLAFFCREGMEPLKAWCISQSREYGDWKTRMALLIRSPKNEMLFCNLHMGWWKEEKDSFSQQWNRLIASLPTQKTVWLMGDFNNPAEVRHEGYDLIASSGFYDSYRLAKAKRGDVTVQGEIDGWRGKLNLKSGIELQKGLRIDQIWCNHPISVKQYQTVLDGTYGKVISDHFGVLTETAEINEIKQ